MTHKNVWTALAAESTRAKLEAKDATIARLCEALAGVVAAHDNYLFALGPAQAALAKDPLTDACEAARAALESSQ